MTTYKSDMNALIFLREQFSRSKHGSMEVSHEMVTLLMPVNALQLPYLRANFIPAPGRDWRWTLQAYVYGPLGDSPTALPAEQVDQTTS